tara:strand:- start:1090 stop:2793 length:1704 start_codon:yes stop_codon:yes gene_type:complete
MADSIQKIRVEGGKEAEAAIQGVQGALEKFNKTASKNRDAVRLLDKATGGAVTKFNDLQRGIIQGTKGIKGLTLGFKGLKGAIAATGIGLIVVALGTIVAYWDEIKALVSGVSIEQDELLKSQEKSAIASEEIYNNINASANILKQQGKTEKEILALKIKSTDESITALEAQLTTQKAIKKAQEETALRNKDILEGAVKMITLPLFILLETIDSIGTALGKQFGLTEGLYGSLGDLIFDPEGVKEKGEETISETENQLLALKNRKAGFEIGITKIEEQEFEKRQAAKQAQYKIEFDAYKKHLEDMTQLTIDDIEKLGKIRKSYNDKIDAQAVVDEETRLELDREKALKEIEELELAEGLKGNARLAVNTFFDNQLLDLQKKNDIESKALRLADFTNTKEIESAKYALLGQFGGLLSQIAGENKTLAIAGVVAQQAAAVGQIISQTAIANAKSIAAFPLTLGQPFVGINTASAGLSIASTIAAASKSISKIKSSDTSASTMNANVPSGGGGAPSGAPAFNIVGQNDTSQLAEAITGQTQQPIKAYVVSNEVTTAQSLDRNIVQGATIG